MSIVEMPAVQDLREIAEQSNAWPFEEAKKLVARLKRKPKDEVIFETGYGPSGLPHIGTFGEVARTTMVRHAFRVLTDDKIKTRLIAFSDDMDGLRKVPDNVPNKEMLAQHLGKPLTQVPDPFSNEYPSFGAANNARLRAFLDQFGFQYEFMSSTDCYMSGRFDAALLRVLERFDAVMNIMLPSLREERAQTYSPFLPISPTTGIVLQVPILAHDAKAGTITYEDPDTKEQVTTLVTGGRCKLQWKPDWAMRWYALGIDYEMAGKDLIDSVKLSGEICRALGGTAPEGFNYELFLDEKGQKISKSKGNGLTIDEWLRYASPESLSLFMYREPKSAKRLYFDVIPRHVDEYQQFLEGYERQDTKQRLSNPVWHIHSGEPPKPDMPVSFSMLLTLVSSSNAENADTLWGFIGRYRPGVTRESHPRFDRMVNYAIHYFHDFVLPTKRFRDPSPEERAALMDLRDALSQLPHEATAEQIQDVVYEIGRREPFLDQKKKAKDGKPGVSLDWFNMLYQVLLGQEKGPRFGSFVAVYGLQNTVEMIDGALARSDPAKTTAVQIDFMKIRQPADIGVTRATVFLGLAANAAGVESLSHVLDDRVQFQFVPKEVPPTTAAHFKEEFNYWVIGNALRELVESYSAFLIRCRAALQIMLTKKINDDELRQIATRFENKNISEQYTEISDIVRLEPTYLKMFEAFRLARNCLAHRRGVVAARDANTKEGHFELRWCFSGIFLRMADGAEQLIDNDTIGDGISAGEGGAIVLRQAWKEKIFPLGSQIKLSRHDLGEICFGVHLATAHIIDRMHKFALANGIPESKLDNVDQAANERRSVAGAPENLDRDD